MAEGGARFDPGALATAVVHQWPTAEVAHTDSPELADLAEFMTTQITIEVAQQRVIVELHTGGRSVDIEGDDGLAAEFLALLTQSTPIPKGQIVAMNWAADIATLRQNMTAVELLALRD